MHFVVLSVCLKLWCCSVPCANAPANIPEEEDISTKLRHGFIDKEIKVYEYGNHVPEERLSFKLFNGSIPVFHPIAVLNASSEDPDLRPEFTYLRVDYRNPWSVVNVFYDPETYTINVHIKYPFVETKLGALGYSLPKET